MFTEEKLKEIADFWEGDNWTTEEGGHSLWPKDPWENKAKKIESIFWDELISGDCINVDAKKEAYG